MRVLVTGGTGFIGIHVIAELMKRSWQVRCLVRATSNRRALAGYEVEYVVGSLEDPVALRQAVQDIDVVIHLAGATKAQSIAEFDRINHGGTQYLVEACVQSGVHLRSFVYISSIAAAGPSVSATPLTEDDAPHPVGPYGRSKLLAEQAVLKASSRLPVTVLRPSAIYGPRDTDFLPLFRAVKRGLLPCLGRQELHVDICYVEDLVQGILAAAACPAARGEVFFLGGAPYTWRNMGHEIARQLGTRPYELHLPRTLALSAATLADRWARLSGRPGILSRANMLERLQPFWLFDSGKARRTFGYAPQVSLARGIAQTLAWYREAGWL